VHNREDRSGYTGKANHIHDHNGGGMRVLDDLSLKTPDREAIVAASTMLRDRFPVTRVLLFGSKATGRDRPDSDIDLLVVTSRPLLWRERDAVIDALFDVEMEHDVLISVMVVSESDWDSAPYRVLPIREEIDRDGVAA
jgi:predicted nucleotidyltransferase